MFLFAKNIFGKWIGFFFFYFYLIFFSSFILFTPLLCMHTIFFSLRLIFRRQQRIFIVLFVLSVSVSEQFWLMLSSILLLILYSFECIVFFYSSVAHRNSRNLNNFQGETCLVCVYVSAWSVHTLSWIQSQRARRQCITERICTFFHVDNTICILFSLVYSVVRRNEWYERKEWKIRRC